jgi:ubiquinone/menaquinone biosynthesis C-methylase UbiE
VSREVLDAPRYDLEGAQRYDAHHEKNLRTRLTTWRERSLLRRALAGLGPVESILDMPCGGGRFFPALIHATAGEIIGADNSAGMLAVAARSPEVMAGRIRLLETSAFAIALPDRTVDCVVSERFFHHLALAEDRLRALAEMRRVTRRYLVLSLWVDGNLQARRRGPRQPVPGYGRRGVLPRTVAEVEFATAGFALRAAYDLLPRVSMWRLYALEKRD